MTVFDNAASVNLSLALSFVRAGNMCGSGCLDCDIMAQNSFSASIFGTRGIVALVTGSACPTTATAGFAFVFSFS